MFAPRSRRIPSKVVTIPVHFVESKPRLPAPAAAATRIQKAFRGHAVRRSLRAVRGLEAEVERAEREVEEGRGSIWRDEKERLRLSETLMGVLFRLDSVRGVREYRKRVVRRAVRLQEKLDFFAEEKSGSGTSVEDEERENGIMEEEKRGNGVENEIENGITEEENRGNGVEDEIENGIMEEEKREGRESRSAKEERDGDVGMGDIVEEKGEMVEDKREEMEKGVVDRMVEESERLRGMVTELLEKNALQCKLMCGLSKRVEDLERKVDALGRNKKKTNKKRKN